MSFEIRFLNGEPVPFETLNAEAANLWGIGIARDQVRYVFPKGDELLANTYDENNSWFEMIGDAIMHPQIYGERPYPNWPDVRETLFIGQVDAADVWEKDWFNIQLIITSTINWLQPYNELIDLWESKGYNPIRIKE